MIKTLRSLLSYTALATIVLVAVVTTQLGTTQKTVAAESTRSLYVYISPTGSDTGGNGSLGKPLKTLAYAAKQVQPNQNYTIYLNPGLYRETEATVLPEGVNIEGAGESSVTITSNGAIPAPGVNTGSSDWSLWHHGSIIQLVSPSYSGSNPRYGTKWLVSNSSQLFL
ncbi:hypothetical protein [Nostoc sp.]|uniref:hypothetical protein n=1 Tax=Nostoc sp. TaxID=1180 RepID=UPI002FF8ECC5